MSLSIWLKGDKEVVELCQCSRCDNEHEHKYYPMIYNCNITHNLGRMAEECGIYDFLWRAPENDIKTANQLIGPLRDSLLNLESEPFHFSQFNPKNGWGSYDTLIIFLTNLLNKCIENPNAIIETNR